MMQEISLMIIPILLGVLVGFAYTSGAQLLQSLVKPCRYFVMILAVLAYLSVSFGWIKLGFSLSVALGICLVVWFKLYWLRPNLPLQLHGSLAARPGESVPDLCPNDVGGWTMVYPDGMCMRYDSKGALVGVEFNNGWDRSEWILQGDRRNDSCGSSRMI